VLAGEQLPQKSASSTARAVVVFVPFALFVAKDESLVGMVVARISAIDARFFEHRTRLNPVILGTTA
jgi:hypothetical protein